MKTLVEIREQPEKHHIFSEKYSEAISDLKNFIEEKKPTRIDFVGCGTSYYLAMGCSMQMNRISSGKSNSHFYSGSEIMFGLEKLPEGTLLIGLSRSGESSETVGALRTARKMGLNTAAITCEPGSSMTKEAVVSAEMDFIKEVSIVMTKSFTSMGFLVSALARDLYKNDELDNYLKIIPEVSKRILENTEKLFDAMKPGTFDHFVFLGYGEYFAAGMEGVIKVTETSLSEVDCYQTLEYRHGPKSKVREGTLVTLLSNPALVEEEIKVAREIEEMGGKVLLITSEKDYDFNSIITNYRGLDFGDWFLRAIPLQLIGINRAVEKGLDPDKPTHLTKVVKF